MSAASRYGSGDTSTPCEESSQHYREAAATPLRAAVINAGGWGTALAVLLAGQGHAVALWTRRPDLAEEINRRRENADYLRGVPIPNGVRATANLEEAVAGRDLVVLAPISAALGQVAERLRGLISPDTLVVHGTKGLQPGTLLRGSQVIERALGPAFQGRVGALSGPTHAEEVGRGIPTAAVVGCADPERA